MGRVSEIFPASEQQYWYIPAVKASKIQNSASTLILPC